MRLSNPSGQDGSEAPPPPTILPPPIHASYSHPQLSTLGSLGSEAPPAGSLSARSGTPHTFPTLPSPAASTSGASSAGTEQVGFMFPSGDGTPAHRDAVAAGDLAPSSGGGGGGSGAPSLDSGPASAPPGGGTVPMFGSGAMFMNKAAVPPASTGGASRSRPGRMYVDILNTARPSKS